MSDEHVTSDIMTYVVKYCDWQRHALKSQPGITLTQYRVLAYLSDHADGARASALARDFELSPAAITLAVRPLIERELVKREATSNRSGQFSLKITRGGFNTARDADVVVATEHEVYFSPLPPSLKAIVVAGSMIANAIMSTGNRVREGHFFDAFETLHAFFINRN